MSLKQLRIHLFSFLSWTKRFLRENPGALFVLGFEVVLVSCAVLLAAGLASSAEGLAVVAYFMLVAGVVMQLVWFVRGSRDGRVEG
jgi:hypothetical protein